MPDQLIIMRKQDTQSVVTCDTQTRVLVQPANNRTSRTQNLHAAIHTWTTACSGGRAMCDCIMDERIECDGPEFQVQPQRHSNHGTAASLEGWMDRVQIGHHAVHILSGRVGLAYYILWCML
jgi:hypothetical protein